MDLTDFWCSFLCLARPCYFAFCSYFSYDALLHRCASCLWGHLRHRSFCLAPLSRDNIRTDRCRRKLRFRTNSTDLFLFTKIPYCRWFVANGNYGDGFTLLVPFIDFPQWESMFFGPTSDEKQSKEEHYLL